MSKISEKKKRQRKNLRLKIKNLGSDGVISAKDIKKIQGKFGGKLHQSRISKLVTKYSTNNDVKLRGAKRFDRILGNKNPKFGGPGAKRIPQNVDNTTTGAGEDPYTDPTVEEQLETIGNTYTEEMALADDPRNRRYVLGIRTKRGDRNRQGARGTFGRKGKRIQGLTNTSINL